MSIQLQFKHQYVGFDLAMTLDLPAHGTSVILGASGSGKTTLLRLIAGLERPANGHVSIGKTIWQSKDYFAPAHSRSVGYVFQEARLFPHLTVMQNIQYAAKRSVAAKPVIKVDDAIVLMQISHLLDRKPERLSGGEKQRVAMVRALAAQPNILLMDEPLAALDNALKAEITPYIASISALATIPIVYVTHALNEAKMLADYVVEIAKGSVLHAGNAQKVIPLIAKETRWLGSAHLTDDEALLLRHFRSQTQVAQQAILTGMRY